MSHIIGVEHLITSCTVITHRAAAARIHTRVLLSSPHPHLPDTWAPPGLSHAPPRHLGPVTRGDVQVPKHAPCLQALGPPGPPQCPPCAPRGGGSPWGLNRGSCSRAPWPHPLNQNPGRGSGAAVSHALRGLWSRTDFENPAAPGRRAPMHPLKPCCWKPLPAPAALGGLWALPLCLGRTSVGMVRTLCCNCLLGAPSRLLGCTG